jgi:hypothetical protein
MNNKLIRGLSVVALSFLLVGCATITPLNEVVEVTDLNQQTIMYEQVVNSELARESDGSYSFNLEGMIGIGMFSTRVNGVLNYNYLAATQKVTADFKITGMWLEVTGKLSEDQDLQIQLQLLGINLLNITEKLEIAAYDLPDLVNFSALEGFDREACLSNYRTATRSVGGVVNNYSLFAVSTNGETTTDGKICGKVEHFRTNPTVGFVVNNTVLNGGYINAQLLFERFEFDVELFVSKLNA